MPLSRPYGVTRPVVGQMFHVKHSLWHRWCSGRRRPRLWGRAAVCAGGRRPAREPSAPRAFGSARRLEARPGPAAAHGHRSQALLCPSVPPAPSTPAVPGVLVCGSPCPATAHRYRGQVPTPPTATATVCKKSAAPAGLRTCVELRRCRNSLSGGRPSRCAWCRRAR